MCPDRNLVLSLVWGLDPSARGWRRSDRGWCQSNHHRRGPTDEEFCFAGFAGSEGSDPGARNA